MPFWLIYAALLFLCLLAGYAAIYADELMGPTPPETLSEDLLAEAEQPPPDVSTLLRPAWERAFSLRMQADAEPTPENLRRAVYAYRLIATNHAYRNTAYSNVAMRRLVRMERTLFEMGEYVPPFWSVSGDEY